MKISIVLGMLVCLSACTDNKTKVPDQLYGKWQMLDDISARKGFVLEPNGRVEFIEMELQDIGRGEKGVLPLIGKWEMSTEENQVIFWFRFNGGEYGQGGHLKRKKGRSEIWFPVGDPDDFVWRRFIHSQR